MANKKQKPCEPTALEVLELKKFKKELSTAQIEWFVKNAVSGVVQPSQLGAFLMAVRLNGLSERETADLTKAMANSGDSLKWNNEEAKLVVDKHSTGGVGDKVTLILAPALAACGLLCPTISGRGLGITGGTIDKLEAIPGMKFEYSTEEIEQLTRSSGVCIVSQSKELNPADKLVYATRDVTSTVDNISLITASIMSKKYCERPAALLLDVKCGKSAFMKTVDDAKKLAESMQKVGKLLNVNTSVTITQMDDPIGTNIGNSLETEESLETLKGRGHRDLIELVECLGSRLLMAVGKATSNEQGKSMIKQVLNNGRALEKFCEMIHNQGVEKSIVEKLKEGHYDEVFGKAKERYCSKVYVGGFVKSIDAVKLATVVKYLGGGRFKSTDQLDYQAGIRLHKHVGDRVEPGDIWCEVEYNKSHFDVFEEVDSAIEIGDEPLELKRILAVL